MANLTETSTWESGIYQLETTDPVQGGAGGIDNLQPNQLANRTKKIYDVLAAAGIFITPGEEVFVGQPIMVNPTFEGTVADEDLVYWNTTNTQFEKALADGTEKQNVVGMADVTNGRVVAGGLLQTGRSDTKGDILYLSATVAGAVTTTDTGVAIGRYEYDGVITLSPAASASASAASIPPGSVTPAMLQESYYTQSDIDAKCGNWDSAYSERRQWDGGATNLVAATGRTSLGLTGDVSTHNHDSMYYTKTEINAKCGNWDTAYTQTRQWDGGASGLVAATGRTSLGLTGDVSTHNHDSMYYTKTQINACCSNWDSAYSERRQWDGGATNLNASNARTSLGLTGDVSTHNHDSMYYTKTEIDATYAPDEYEADSSSSLIEIKTDIVSSRAAGAGATPTEIKRIVVHRGGTIRVLTKISYDANPSGIPIYCRVYVNGSPYGSPHNTTAFLPSWAQFIDVISGLSVGDTVSIYLYTGGPAQPQEAHVKFEINVDNPTMSYIDYEAAGLATYSSNPQYDYTSNRFVQ